jgi:hypothetical protein
VIDPDVELFEREFGAQVVDVEYVGGVDPVAECIEATDDAEALWDASQRAHLRGDHEQVVELEDRARELEYLAEAARVNPKLSKPTIRAYLTDEQLAHVDARKSRREAAISVDAIAVPASIVVSAAVLKPTVVVIVCEPSDHVTDYVAADGHRLSDTGNAARLVDLLDGRARFVHAWTKWIVYRHGHWVLDDGDALISEKAKGVANRLFRFAARQGLDSKARDRRARSRVVEASGREILRSLPFRHGAEGAFTARRTACPPLSGPVGTSGFVPGPAAPSGCRRPALGVPSVSPTPLDAAASRRLGVGIVGQGLASRA